MEENQNQVQNQGQNPNEVKVESPKPGAFFLIPVEIYRGDCAVSIGQTDQELRDSLKDYMETEELDYVVKELEEDGTSEGVVIDSSGRPVVRFFSWDKTIDHHDIVSHEVFHAVCVIMRAVDIPLSKKSEEAYAYLQGFLAGEIKKVMGA